MSKHLYALFNQRDINTFSQTGAVFIADRAASNQPWDWPTTLVEMLARLRYGDLEDAQGTRMIARGIRVPGGTLFNELVSQVTLKEGATIAEHLQKLFT